jgi:hypothetical protein
VSTRPGMTAWFPEAMLCLMPSAACNSGSLHSSVAHRSCQRSIVLHGVPHAHVQLVMHTRKRAYITVVRWTDGRSEKAPEKAADSLRCGLLRLGVSACLCLCLWSGLCRDT